MPEPIEIRIRVPESLGLTAQQIADLKQKVRVEIVASTLPVQGLRVATPQQIVAQCVDDCDI
jgi:flagellar motor switch/type III secretory pathway protein FliN